MAHGGKNQPGLYEIVESPLMAFGIVRFCDYCLGVLPKGLDLLAQILSEVVEAETALVFKEENGALAAAGRFAIEGPRAEPDAVAAAVKRVPDLAAQIFNRDKFSIIDSEEMRKTDPLICAGIGVDSYLSVALPSDLHGMEEGTTYRLLACNSRQGTVSEVAEILRKSPFRTIHSHSLRIAFDAWGKQVKDILRLKEEAGELWRRGELWWDQFRQLVLLVVDIADPYTSGHSKRVEALSTIIAKHLSPPLTEYQLAALRLAGAGHDLGKVGVRMTVLNKPTQLTFCERAMVDAHSLVSHMILTNVPYLRQISRAALMHHRWYDGSKGPGSGVGDEIPRLARIIAVADSFDTMVSARAYQPVPMTFDDAAAELKRNKSKQFDPNVVDALLEAVAKGDVARAGIREVEVASATAAVKKATHGFKKHL